jgi:hypothetical protein
MALYSAASALIGANVEISQLTAIGNAVARLAVNSFRAGLSRKDRKTCKAVLSRMPFVLAASTNALINCNTAKGSDPSKRNLNEASSNSYSRHDDHRNVKMSGFSVLHSNWSEMSVRFVPFHHSDTPADWDVEFVDPACIYRGSPVQPVRKEVVDLLVD